LRSEGEVWPCEQDIHFDAIDMTANRALARQCSGGVDLAAAVSFGFSIAAGRRSE
jgi:hypothetical protein